MGLLFLRNKSVALVVGCRRWLTLRSENGLLSYCLVYKGPERIIAGQLCSRSSLLGINNQHLPEVLSQSLEILVCKL